MYSKNTTEWQSAQQLDAFSCHVAEVKTEQSCSGTTQARKLVAGHTDRFPLYAVNRWAARPSEVCAIGGGLMKKRSPPPAAREEAHHRLNPEQRAVVAHPVGRHALVCAGADLETVRDLVDDYVQLDDAERRRLMGGSWSPPTRPSNTF